jgi:hypothetical protein
MIAIICNILMYFIFKIMFCECLWYDPNYFICVYHLLCILIKLLHYLPKKLHCFEDPSVFKNYSLDLVYVSII